MPQQTAGQQRIKLSKSYSTDTALCSNSFQRLNVVTESMAELGLFDFVHARFFSGGASGIPLKNHEKRDNHTASHQIYDFGGFLRNAIDRVKPGGIVSSGE